MFMQKTLMLCFTLIAVLIVPDVRAADLMPIKSLSAPTAVFESSDGKKFAMKGAAGKLVACDRAVLTALEGSVFFGDCTLKEPTVHLGKGAFHIYVGGEPLIIQAGAQRLKIVDSELIISKIKSHWIVQTKPLSQDGFIELLISEKQAPVVNDSASKEKTIDSNLENAIVEADLSVLGNIHLTPKVRLRLDSGSTLERANSFESKIFDSNINALFVTNDTAATSSLLHAVEVTQKSDFDVSHAVTATSLNEVEVEDIEVEVGCVEICAD